MTTLPQNKSIFQSLTIRSAAAMALAFIASRAGIDLPAGLPQEIVGAAIDLIGAIGLAGVAIGRARASGPLS